MKNTTTLSILASLTTGLVSASSSITQQLVPTELQQEKVETFLDCVKRTGKHYDVTVEAPWIIVIPSEDRAINYSSVDQALQKCVHDSAGNLMVMVGSTHFGRDEYVNTTSVHAMQASDIHQAGAMSLEAHQIHQATPVKRAPSPDQYYGAYPDEYMGCGNLDYKATQYDTCVTVMSAYKSIKAENANTVKKLDFTIWPHHDCSKGNERKVTVNPRSINPCIDRTTYSYKGSLES